MTARTTQTAPHEYSAWMRARLAKLKRQARSVHRTYPDRVVICPLGKTGEPGSREDRTCDRCRAYVPPDGTTFYLGQIQPEPWLMVVGGLCSTCAKAEGGGPR